MNVILMGTFWGNLFNNFKPFIKNNRFLPNTFKNTQFINLIIDLPLVGSYEEKLIMFTSCISAIPKCSNPTCYNNTKVVKRSFNSYCSRSCALEHRNREGLSEKLKEKYTQTTDEYNKIKTPATPEQIKEYYEKNKKNMPRFFQFDKMSAFNKNINILKGLDSFPGEGYPEKLFNFLGGKGGKCEREECHNPKKFMNFSRGYTKFCSSSCSSLHNAKELNTIKSKNIPKKLVDNQNFNKFKIKLVPFSLSNLFLLECINCGNSFDICLNNGKMGKKINCPYCGNNKSKNEKKLQDLIKGSIINSRKIIKPFELDIYSENHKLAIEYNGLMFHSYGKSKYSMFDNFKSEDKTRHLVKTQKCEELGVQLFHIFENEWLNKSEIWKSVINSKLGNSARVFARKCVVKELSSSEAREFCETNHLQGSTNASVRLGLYLGNELVMVQTFGKARFSKQYEYELIRCCSKLGVLVVGGASKLLSYFEKNIKPSSLVSYANRRWSLGNVYEKLGFELSHISEPNYFYFKPGSMKLESRNSFQKHKLKDKLEIFDPGLTETENMFNNDYRRIWDCGNKVYVKKY